MPAIFDDAWKPNDEFHSSLSALRDGGGTTPVMVVCVIASTGQECGKPVSCTIAKMFRADLGYVDRRPRVVWMVKQDFQFWKQQIIPNGRSPSCSSCWPRLFRYASRSAEICTCESLTCRLQIHDCFSLAMKPQHSAWRRLMW
eukprot:Blabericola_migrator_1__6400@NODE_3227_length_1931_cov_9_883047_g2020_i0_p1_GENE_NODE_3227_length_1931_cov_9_883047_g2020_i0NODE_3227_length_1931_cov_9_883047_g2020_i0_p1_ORF_typecomplete_len143_score7_60_NODE_3227_length_1931_cov_9_883047_g2020_i09361364